MCRIVFSLVNIALYSIVFFLLAGASFWIMVVLFTNNVIRLSDSVKIGGCILLPPISSFLVILLINKVKDMERKIILQTVCYYLEV